MVLCLVFDYVKLYNVDMGGCATEDRVFRVGLVVAQLVETQATLDPCWLSLCASRRLNIGSLGLHKSMVTWLGEMMKPIKEVLEITFFSLDEHIIL